MKKNALFGLALLATAFFALTSADYKSLEEQNAAIEKSVKRRALMSSSLKRMQIVMRWFWLKQTRWQIK